MPLRGLLCLLTLLTSACSIHNDDYPDKGPVWSDPQKMYSVDDDGRLKNDRRMERIQAQGRKDKSADGGARFGS